jgi:hypothetical protein
MSPRRVSVAGQKKGIFGRARRKQGSRIRGKPGSSEFPWDASRRAVDASGTDRCYEPAGR